MSEGLQLPDRLRFAQLPTPIEKLDRLTRHLGGPEIYVKRDDQTGLATGGNKARKLEFLFADALNQQCDHVVTLGGPQSNHVRQTAAAAAQLGLDCSLVVARPTAGATARQPAPRRAARRADAFLRYAHS